MADSSENTALLSDNDHEEGSIINGGTPESTTKTLTNSHFERSIKILRILVSVISGLTFISLITAIVVLHVGSFTYTFGTQPVVLDLGITTFVSLILGTLMVFLQLPAIVTLIIDMVLPILILIYSGNLLNMGWPHINFCHDGRYYDPNHPKFDNSQCLTDLLVLRISVGVAAGLGFVLGLLYLTILILRIITISKTKVWKKEALFAPGQYTFSITLNVIGKDVNGRPHTPHIAEEQGQLVDA